MQNLSFDSVSAPTADQSTADFPLGIAGFTYADLYRPLRLRALAETFYAELAHADAPLQHTLSVYLAARGTNLTGTKQESELLIAAAPHLASFIARLFNIEPARTAHIAEIKAQDPIFGFKFFIARRALKKFPAEQALTLDAAALDAALAALRRAA